MEALTMHEQVVLSEALRTTAMLSSVNTDRSRGVARMLVLIRIAEKVGLQVKPDLGGTCGVEFVVPGYEPPPTILARELQPGDVVTIHESNYMVRDVKTSSGGITVARLAAGRTDEGFTHRFFASDPVEYYRPADDGPIDSPMTGDRES